MLRKFCKQVEPGGDFSVVSFFNPTAEELNLYLVNNAQFVEFDPTIHSEAVTGIVNGIVEFDMAVHHAVDNRFKQEYFITFINERCAEAGFADYPTAVALLRGSEMSDGVAVENHYLRADINNLVIDLEALQQGMQMHVNQSNDPIPLDLFKQLIDTEWSNITGP